MMMADRHNDNDALNETTPHLRHNDPLLPSQPRHPPPSPSSLNTNDNQHSLPHFTTSGNVLASSPSSASLLLPTHYQHHQHYTPRPDSGYNTSSPATTASPANALTPSRQQHFCFDYDDVASSATLIEHAATASQSTDRITEGLSAARRLRLSPDIFETSSTSSPGPALSDSHMTQFHMDGSDDDTGEELKRQIPVSSIRGRDGNNFIGFQLPNLSNESDEIDDDDEAGGGLYNQRHGLYSFGVASEPQTPRYRSGSLSLRTRRYCTIDNNDYDHDDIIIQGTFSIENGPHSATPTLSGSTTTHHNYEVVHSRGRSLRHDAFRGGRAARSQSFSAFRNPGNFHRDDKRAVEDSDLCCSPGAVIWAEPRQITPNTLLTRDYQGCHSSHQTVRNVSLSQDFAGAMHEDTMFSFDQEDIESYHSGLGHMPDEHTSDLNSSFGFPHDHWTALGEPGITSEDSRSYSTHRVDNPPYANVDSRVGSGHVLSASPSLINNARPPGSAPVLIDRPPQSPASIARRRRVGVVSLSTHLRTSSGHLLPTARSVLPVEPAERSIATQTPHATCNIIEQLMSTPAPLPSSARGTAADRLRHFSDGTPAWPGSIPPLPDIVPLTTIGSGVRTRLVRDRSASAPDLRARMAGREAGRELRRLSDEFFNSFSHRRSLSPVREDRGGHPASFPRMRNASYFRNVANNVGNFINDAFGVRRGSSVDLDDLDSENHDHDL